MSIKQNRVFLWAQRWDKQRLDLTPFIRAILDDGYAQGWNEAIEAATGPLQQAMANLYAVSKGEGGGDLCAELIVAIRQLKKDASP